MIQIPGYRLLRQLGRGGMATVYLAIQESIDREVALKVMSPALLADPNFGERFLREAKIAAKLHHRHVVGIHDVGRAGDYHYIAMEYLAGGPVLNKGGDPRSIMFALRVVREIAGALGYASENGFVHRDVKPDNILLRNDGSSALTDFGIARANDGATRMTRTGAVVGTPHYMSPEQARGKTIDGRSDLYGLGIVLYEMLVGRVPYHADDSLAVGIMHITQPVPRLPETLIALQPLIDRLLAKEPEERFQSGEAVAAAIEAIEARIEDGELPELAAAPAAYRREPRASETAVSPSLSDIGRRRRSDPSFGRLDEVAATPDGVMRAEPRTRKIATTPSRGPWIGVAIAVVLLLAAAAAGWRYQDRLRALIPSTELNDVLARAGRALDAGKLIGTPESARELYQSARSIDPDNDVARNGLTRVGDKLLERANAALDRKDVAAARQDLDAARDLLGGGSGVEDLDKRLKANESHTTETESLLAKAQGALDANRILGADGAAAIYQRVLAAEPDNALATSGLRKSADVLATQARAAIAANDAATANARSEEIARLLPNYPDLPELRGALARSREAEMAAVADLLKRGDAQLRAGRATGGDDSAQALFQAALKRDAGNGRAQAGLRKVAQSLVVQANAALESNNVARAEQLIGQAESIAPDSPELRAAKSNLRELKESNEIAANRPALGAGDQQRVATLVAEAAQAVAAGKLIVPPGDSAYDKYRAALRIDGNNAQALEGLSKLPAHGKELFEQSVKDGLPNRARSMLEAVRQLEPSEPSVPAMVEKLTNLYLDQAETRIGENRRADATRALAAARELSPQSARLATIEQRLRELPDGGP